MREYVGRKVKQFGKWVGSQRLIDAGRHMQYGHHSPERLLKEHPSAFLRTYAIRSQVEHGAQINNDLHANGNTTFQLHTTNTWGQGGSAPAAWPAIREESTNRVRTPAQHFHLIRSDQQASHVENYESQQVGNTFHAAFLPMRQANQDNLGGHATADNVAHMDTGRIRDSEHLAPIGETVTMTAQLSGCTLLKRRDSLLHIRPESDGGNLHGSLPREQTFGRQDYPENTQEAFVMTRRKPNGQTKVYYQIQDDRDNSIRSGSKAFTFPEM